MATEQSAKAKAWTILDRIVAKAAPGGVHTNPWRKRADASLRFEPDIDTLCKLLGVPLHLGAKTQSGVPALALDVWLSYELRRAGFDDDQTWPRAKHPRILPAPVSKLLKELPPKLGGQVRQYIDSTGSIKGVTSSTSSVLGKNYLKQVDVIITDGVTGPELLISTKRMDSSFGNNAANRVEESYGDAKNLRLRHPMAALGFAFGLRSSILDSDFATAEWLFDLLAKLGQEDDAYHATCLVLMEYSDTVAVEDDGEEPPESIVQEPGPEPELGEAPAPVDDVDRVIAKLPRVGILGEKTPENLAPGRFLEIMVMRVLGATPITMHREARNRRSEVAKA